MCLTLEFRRRAETLRAIADIEENTDLKSKLIELADEYERMAERREKGGGT